jgi:hypothetical protein
MIGDINVDGLEETKRLVTKAYPDTQKMNGTNLFELISWG